MRAMFRRVCAGCLSLVALTAVGCGDDGGEGDGSGTGGDSSGPTGGSGPGSGGSGSGGTGSGTGGDTTGGGGSAVDCPIDTCDATCVDLATDEDFCGSCGTSCTEYEECQAGLCKRVSCEGTLTLCTDACFDLDTDELHCGDCDEACDLTFTCESGSCGCTGDQVECGGSCTYTDYDRAHCGSCADAGGTACGDTEACVGGTCQEIGVPEESYCAATNDWSDEHTAYEFELLDLVNRRRAEGADCGDEGVFAPTGPLQMDASLRCAARMHTFDMVDRDFFSHTNPDGDGPGPRLDAAGYQGSGWGENIAAGQSSPTSVMAGWMSSSGHCANIMNPDYDAFGAGYLPGGDAEYSHYWTQTFGRLD